VNDAFVGGGGGGFEARIALYASHGEGRFEDPEKRDIAANVEPVVRVLKEHAGLGAESVVADVGAGTGLLLAPLAKASKLLYALELSPDFRRWLRQRSEAEGLENVDVRPTTATTVPLAAASIDVAFLCDVYHHLEFPRTFCRALRAALKPEGRLVVLDFIKDEAVIKSMPAGWATAHLRAGQDVFRQEILDAGFLLDAEPHVETLRENFIMVFKKAPAENLAARPGTGWSSAPQGR